MTTTDPFTEAARAEAQRAYQDTGMPRYDLAVHMAEWARSYLAAQEPTEDDAHAAWEEWNRHLARLVKPGVIRCYCGAPGFWGNSQGHGQHALWHALSAARRARGGTT